MKGRDAIEARLAKEGNRAAEGLARRLAKDGRDVEAVVRAAGSEVKKVKNGAGKTLQLLSRERPDRLVPHLAWLVQCLDGGDSILRWIALDVLGNVVAVDGARRRIDARVLRTIQTLAMDPTLVTAAHAVSCLGRVAAAKPSCRAEITAALLDTGRAARNVECRDILAGKVLDALSLYAEAVRPGRQLDSIAEFARRHARSRRAATRKRTAALMKRLERAGRTCA